MALALNNPQMLTHPSKSIDSQVPKLTEYQQYSGGARGVVVIVVGNGHGDTSSNPGRD